MKPTLPEPEVIDKHIPTGVVIRGYTAETVQRLIDAAYAAGLEDAARSCEEREFYIRGKSLSASDGTSAFYKSVAYQISLCSSAIRALKD